MASGSSVGKGGEGEGAGVWGGVGGGTANWSIPQTNPCNTFRVKHFVMLMQFLL